ncbi:hypothetical protein [Cryptosporangium minutisporangium]|uniref:Uncharacterized protein n=1 Tax=Cryptosporangium minutisporangium TaxID=113569 RepID=A0ABP6ST91_9ACTN
MTAPSTPEPDHQQQPTPPAASTRMARKIWPWVVGSMLLGILIGVAATVLVINWPHKNRSYDSVAELAAEIGCTPTAVPNPDLAIERGYCETPRGQVVIGIHRNHSQAMISARGIVTGHGGRRLVGPNWTIGCVHEPDCDAYQDKLGGEFVEGQ